MAEIGHHDRAWSIWFNILLLVVCVAAIISAGPADFIGNEVGVGFFPKLAAFTLMLLSTLNLVSIVRSTERGRIFPETISQVFIVGALGISGIVIFQMVGLVVALFFLFVSFLSISERQFTWKNVAIALTATIIFHGFFVGLLGIFDPPGELINVRWLTPW